MEDPEDPNDFIYHVTYFRNLEGIAEEGITPGNAPAIGTSIYDEHRKGKIFLTEAGGVIFWYGKSEEWAGEIGGDDWAEEGLVPVVLRVLLDEELEEELEEDEPGTRDAAYDAWTLEGEIVDDIEVYSDGEWIPVEDWEEISVDDALEFVEDESEDDPDYLGYYELKSDDENPLYPDFHRLG